MSDANPAYARMDVVMRAFLELVDRRANANIADKSTQKKIDRAM